MNYKMSLDQLKQEYLWGLHRSKIPYMVPNATGGEYRAHVDRANDWKTFADAAAKIETFDGYALRFAQLNQYTLCGLDIDAPNGVNSHTDELVRQFAGTYMEYSPSGKGVHIIMLVQIDKIPTKDAYKQTYRLRNDNEKLEFYVGGITNRFFTFTGNRIGECTNITDMTEEALAFLEKYMRIPQEIPTNSPRPATATSIEFDAHEIERRISRACVLRPGFEALYVKGDTSQYSNNASIADEALCGHLAYYFDCNAAVMDEVFRRSALMRSKWDERRGNRTYGEMTIEKAISTHKGYVYSDALTRAVLDGNKKQRLTIDLLADELNKYGYTIKLNAITYEMDVHDINGREIEFDSLVTMMHSDLGGIYTGCSFAVLENYMQEIGNRSEYNPVLEYLHTLVWDGQDYLSRFYDLLRISPSDWLSRALVRKWLLQTYGILFNNKDRAFCADGVLTLSGKQGWGKSSIFAMLALKTDWFEEGSELKTFDKDTARWSCSNWIVEFGEVEHSFSKASAEEMKKFISKKMDRFRPPYARNDVYKPRRTSLCATCNNERYLIDQTGNRRWYTIKLEDQIPYDDIINFPVEQLWAQIIHIAKNGTKAECDWHLNAEEAEALNRRNDSCKQPLKSEEEVVSVLDWATNNPDAVRIASVTATDWINAWSGMYRQLSQKYSSEQIGRALRALGYETERGTVNGTRGRYYQLPIPK